MPVMAGHSAAAALCAPILRMSYSGEPNSSSPANVGLLGGVFVDEAPDHSAGTQL
jgi:hypothetical protein